MLAEATNTIVNHSNLNSVGRDQYINANVTNVLDPSPGAGELISCSSLSQDALGPRFPIILLLTITEMLLYRQGAPGNCGVAILSQLQGVAVAIPRKEARWYWGMASPVFQVSGLERRGIGYIMVSWNSRVDPFVIAFALTEL
jgi:hypothetical protein